MIPPERGNDRCRSKPSPSQREDAATLRRGFQAGETATHESVPLAGTTGGNARATKGDTIAMSTPQITLESITLTCICGDLRVGGAHRVDIPDFLRLAATDGWRQIRLDDDEITTTIYWDGEVNIELGGTCPACSAAIRDSPALTRRSA